MMALARLWLLNVERHVQHLNSARGFDGDAVRGSVGAVDEESVILRGSWPRGCGPRKANRSLATEISISKHRANAEMISASRWRPGSDRAVDTRSSA